MPQITLTLDISAEQLSSVLEQLKGSGAPDAAPMSESSRLHDAGVIERFYRDTTPGIRRVLDLLSDRADTWVSAPTLAKELSISVDELNGYLGSLGRAWKKLTNGGLWFFDPDRDERGVARYRMGRREAAIISALRRRFGSGGSAA